MLNTRKSLVFIQSVHPAEIVLKLEENLSLCQPFTKTEFPTSTEYEAVSCIRNITAKRTVAYVIISWFAISLQ